MLGTPIEASFTKTTQYQSSFSHVGEVAEPGYYQVKLDSGIQVRLAAQMRSGIAEFHFPAGEASRTLRIDTGHNMGFNVERFKTSRVRQAEIQFHGRMATGSVASQGVDDTAYRVYFAIESDQTPVAYGTFDEFHVTPESRSASGPRAGGYLSFASSVSTLRIRVGISFVSVANAQANLRKEIPGWDLEKVRNDARAAWNDALGRGAGEGRRGEGSKDLLHRALSLAAPSQRVQRCKWGIHRIRRQSTRGRWSHAVCEFLWMGYLSGPGAIAGHALSPRGERHGPVPGSGCRTGGRRATALGDGKRRLWRDGGRSVGLDTGPAFYAFGVREFDTKAALAAMLRGANDPLTHCRSHWRVHISKSISKTGM